MVTLIFLALASISNAVMDVCAFHWHKSIFSRKGFNRQYWDATISWRNKYVDYDFHLERTKIKVLGFTFIKPVQLTDAWHLFKALMIAFVIIAIVNYKVIVNPLLDVFILSTVWNMLFNLFYNRVLKLK